LLILLVFYDFMVKQEGILFYQPKFTIAQQEFTLKF